MAEFSVLLTSGKRFSAYTISRHVFPQPPIVLSKIKTGSNQKDFAAYRLPQQQAFSSDPVYELVPQIALFEMRCPWGAEEEIEMVVWFSSLVPCTSCNIRHLTWPFLFYDIDSNRLLACGLQALWFLLWLVKACYMCSRRNTSSRCMQQACSCNLFWHTSGNRSAKSSRWIRKVPVKKFVQDSQSWTGSFREMRAWKYYQMDAICTLWLLKVVSIWRLWKCEALTRNSNYSIIFYHRHAPNSLRFHSLAVSSADESETLATRSANVLGGFTRQIRSKSDGIDDTVVDQVCLLLSTSFWLITLPFCQV